MPTYKRLTKRFSPILLAIGIPASLKNISEYLQQIIDTMYIGQYSSSSLTAISSALMPILIFESIWIGITIATTVLISQNIGAKNINMAKKVAQSTFVLGLFFAIAFTIFWHTMADTVFAMMNLQGSTANEASIYVRTLALNYVLRYLGSSVPTAILMSQGKTQVLMWATFSQTIINITLNPFFIWGFGFIPEMGLRGAAFGTLCGEMVAISIISRYFWKHDFLNLKQTPFFPIKLQFIERLKIGLPITSEIMIWSLASAFIISMLNKNYLNGGAIFNIGFLLSDLCYRALYGFDVANTTLIGQGFGAKRKDRMIATLRSSFRTKIVSGLFLFGILYIFQNELVSLFSSDPEITKHVLDHYFWILAISLTVITVGINMSTLNGMGYSRYSLYISLICIPIRVLLSWFVIYYTNWGFLGIWIATFVEEIIRLSSTFVVRHLLVHKYWKKWESETI